MVHLLPSHRPSGLAVAFYGHLLSFPGQKADGQAGLGAPFLLPPSLPFSLLPSSRTFLRVWEQEGLPPVLSFHNVSPPEEGESLPPLGWGHMVTEGGLQLMPRASSRTPMCSFSHRSSAGLALMLGGGAFCDLENDFWDALSGCSQGFSCVLLVPVVGQAGLNECHGRVCTWGGLGGKCCVSE